MKERSGRERMKQRERLRGQRVKERQWLRVETMTIVLGGNSLLLLLVWRHWSLLRYERVGVLSLEGVGIALRGGALWLRFCRPQRLNRLTRPWRGRREGLIKVLAVWVFWAEFLFLAVALPLVVMGALGRLIPFPENWLKVPGLEWGVAALAVGYPLALCGLSTRSRRTPVGAWWSVAWV
ncbi:hypothetical protein KTAU_31800 [Thermogemmatispora aurantia]|uniref:hypothetical protein n=1 Tax=Thermogemmatispora aurantia TaxID=2045279 RepID=UPI00124F01D2|nr:hypothetical protein [Thermogemmatispora aurantia]GER84544.1 hypothetical protein KTAU_31800 [Thermogemmatispora aurantia]